MRDCVWRGEIEKLLMFAVLPVHERERQAASVGSDDQAWPNTYEGVGLLASRGVLKHA